MSLMADAERNREKLHGGLVDVVRTATRSSKVEMDTSVQGLKQHIDQVSRELVPKIAMIVTQLETQTERVGEMERGLNTTLGTIQSELGALKADMKKTPEPGETGFLSEHCLAPEGCDQKDYEALCFRAAKFYVDCLEDPSEGFSADEGAFHETQTEFPGVPNKHLIAALKHIHVQMYNRHFSRSAKS